MHENLNFRKKVQKRKTNRDPLLFCRLISLRCCLFSPLLLLKCWCLDVSIFFFNLFLFKKSYFNVNVFVSLARDRIPPSQIVEYSIVVHMTKKFTVFLVTGIFVIVLTSVWICISKRKMHAVRICTEHVCTTCMPSMLASTVTYLAAAWEVHISKLSHSGCILSYSSSFYSVPSV